MVVTLITCIVVFVPFVVLMISKNNGETPESKLDPVVEQKAKILSIVSSGEPLTTEQRDTLFSSLSGPRMLQYHFTSVEKNMIVKVLNAVNTPKEATKKNSSAKGDFSSVPISKLSLR